MESLPSLQEFKELLKYEVLQVVFTKKDGSERTMFCTNKADLVAESKGEGKVHDEDLIKCTDTEINQWRSFRYDQVTSVKVVR